MNKKEFFEEVKNNIGKYLPEDLKGSVIDITEITKHNDTVLHGLTIRKENEAVAPNLYLEEYFDKYESGKGLEQIMKEIVRDYEEANSFEKPVIKEIDFDFEAVKPNLVFQVVDMDLNKNRLKDLAYRPLGNGFAMTYAVRIEDIDGSEGRINISRDLLVREKWDLIEVDKAAVKNTSEKMPAELVSMTNPMFGFDGVNYLDDDSPKFEAGKGMLILSNKNKVQGASAFFYPGVQEKISKVIGQSYFVLPSSIHECILLPDNGMHTAKELGTMVRDANRTVVAPHEVLSDKVYHYDSKKHQLTTVFGEKERNREEAR